MADLGNMFGPGQSMFYLQKYLPLMQKMMQTNDTTDPYKELLDTMHGQYADALGAASSAETDLNSAQAVPAQQVSPMQSGLATLMGGVSSVLAPNLRGNEMAQGALAKKNQGFEDMRKERLQRMEQHYETLAKRAEQLGNMELSLKMSAKAESIKSKQEKEREAMSLAGTLANGDAQRANALDIENLRAKNEKDLLTQRLAAQGMNPDGTPKLTGVPVAAWQEGAITKRKTFDAIKPTDGTARLMAHNDMFIHELAVRSDEIATPQKYVERIARFRPIKYGNKWQDNVTPFVAAGQVMSSWSTLYKRDDITSRAQVIDLLLPVYLKRINPETGKKWTANEVGAAVRQAASGE